MPGTLNVAWTLANLLTPGLFMVSTQPAQGAFGFEPAVIVEAAVVVVEVVAALADASGMRATAAVATAAATRLVRVLFMIINLSALCSRW